MKKIVSSLLTFAMIGVLSSSMAASKPAPAEDGFNPMGCTPQCIAAGGSCCSGQCC